MKLINQTSPEYNGWTLGNSNSTVARYGCACASVSMSLDMDFRSIIDNPNNFTNGDLIVWENISTVKDRKWYYQNSADISLITKYLDEGYRPILETRFNQNEDLMHFVCAIGHEGERIKIADPIDGTIKWFDEAYSSPTRWIYQVVVYDTKHITPSETIVIDKKVFEELVSKSSKYDAFKSVGFDTAEQVVSSIIKLQAEIDNKTKDIEELKSKLSACTQSGQVPNQTLSAIKTIITGKGFWWTKLNRIKELLK